MTNLQAEDVRAIVVETLAEQQRLRHDDIDAVVQKAVATILSSFGFEESDRRDMRQIFSICGAGGEASSRHKAILLRRS
jgi:hypothetical protein